MNIVYCLSGSLICFVKSLSIPNARIRFRPILERKKKSMKYFFNKKNVLPNNLASVSSQLTNCLLCGS